MTSPLLLLAALGCSGATWAPVHLAEAPARTVFRDVAIFDPAAGGLAGRRDVLVDGDRILAVLPAGVATREAVEIDGTGRTLLPGFLDAHAHTASPAGPPGELVLPDREGMLGAWLSLGVTQVWDLGGFHDGTAALGARTDAGEIAGPHLLASHVPVTVRGGHPVRTAKALLPGPLAPLASRLVIEVDGPGDAAAAVAEIAATGATFVKVIDDDLPPSTPRLDGPTLAALTREAHARGLAVVVHIGDEEGLLHALDAGADLVAHGPWQGGVSDETLARLADSGVPVIATLYGFQVSRELAAGTWAPGALDRRLTPEPLWAPLLERDNVFAAQPLLAEFAGAIDPGFAETVRRLDAAGVRLLVGSDAPLAGVYPGTGWHHEVDALLAAGVPPATVLAAATGAGAGTVFADPEAGAIADGRRADLVLVEGDPLADPAALHEIVGVWRLGRRVEPADAPGPGR